MRNAFVTTLLAEAKKNERIFLLTGDLGYAALEPFIEGLPNQFLNMGVAEQHMAGFAAGMAFSGKVPLIYSIATFITLKTLEQVRNDICYHNLNVKIIGTGAGLTYSLYGATHQAVEDIAIMRTLPGMKIICPGDPIEVEKAVVAMLEDPSPCYLRLGARGEPRLNTPDVPFEIGKGIVLREGGDVALISTGAILANVVAAADLLKKEGINPTVISMHTVKPLDYELLEKIFKTHRFVFSVEEHSVIGGLGSAIGEYLTTLSLKRAEFKMIALADSFQESGGWLDYVREKNGLSPMLIADQVRKTLSSL